MHTFKKYPQFINNDPRINRPGYTITKELQYHRHKTLLPEHLIKEMTVLDIGCCTGATGAWAIDHGAKKYVGIDIQQDFTNIAKQDLNDCFPDKNWDILNCSFENYIESNTERFDIVVASGIIYASTQYQQFLKNIFSLADQAVIIESMVPPAIRRLVGDYDGTSTIVQYTHDANMIFTKSYTMFNSSAIPDLGVIKILAGQHGFELDQTSFETLKQGHEIYKENRRFGGTFKKSDVFKISTVDFLYKNKDQISLSHWSDQEKFLTQHNLYTEKSWTFNESVADSFVDHARKHIPDYYRVIDLSVNICKKTLTDHIEDKIVDVGCATGETINKLWSSGLCNLIGVDNSQAMLDRCQNEIAFYVLSNQFPLDNAPFKAVLCNWTLHFIKDKLSYLSDIYKGLADDGFVILTDKTVNDQVDLNLYHNFKRSNGVTDREISLKAESLQGVMFINDVNWYLDNLKEIGFSRVTIINAAPCFTTFLAFK
jgi:tRNA (cmo5U34)-methyltransferase